MTEDKPIPPNVLEFIKNARKAMKKISLDKEQPFHPDDLEPKIVTPGEEKKEIIDPFKKLRDLVDKEIDEDVAREDIFYGVCSDSGYSRKEVDEMELEPYELDLEEWTQEEMLHFIAKWLGKLTHYYVEMDTQEDGNITMEFHNAIKKMMLGYIAVSEKAKKVEGEVDQSFSIVMPQPLGSSFEWIADTVLTMASQTPKMVVPEMDSLFTVG